MQMKKIKIVEEDFLEIHSEELITKYAIRRYGPCNPSPIITDSYKSLLSEEEVLIRDFIVDEDPKKHHE